MKADDLRYLARRALAVAHALEGVPLGPEAPEWEKPFRRIWPARMAVEIGIPDELLYDKSIVPAARLVWIALWRMVHVGAATPSVRIRIALLALLFGAAKSRAYEWLNSLSKRGWITYGRAPSPSAYGEQLVELHMERLTLEATAEEARRALGPESGDG